MSNGVRPPSTKPVWPIVVACLVLVVGITVAAVFVGMNLSDSDDDDDVAGSDNAPSYSAEDSDSKKSSNDADNQKQADEGDQQESDSSESPSPQQSDEQQSDKKNADKQQPDKKNADKENADDSSGSEPTPSDPRLECGNASTVLTTRTAEYGASICRTEDGGHVYRGMSVNIDDSLVLSATLDKATGMWVANNKSTQYTVDADTGKVTIRNSETGEVYGSQAAIEFHTK
ncbi:MAG TPA: hypothetical protein VK059_11320 [Nocardioidaceae bacterium]|nr:hypothetical protein [Nocardioidaceae bacterium]